MVLIKGDGDAYYLVEQMKNVMYFWMLWRALPLTTLSKPLMNDKMQEIVNRDFSYDEGEKTYTQISSVKDLHLFLRANLVPTLLRVAKFLLYANLPHPYQPICFHHPPYYFWNT